MAQLEAWWLQRNSLTAQGEQTVNLTSAYKPLGLQRPPDRLSVEDGAGGEIFYGMRRGGAPMRPPRREAPFGMDPWSNMRRPSMPLQQNPETPWHSSNTKRQPRPELNTAWRAGDDRGFALDNSPRPSYKLPSSRVHHDPEFYGYKQKSNADSGETLFGVPGTPRPPASHIDLNVAAWRPGGTDPHPFTMGGEVPKDMPARNPHRQMHSELMISAAIENTDSYEAARRELAHKVGGENEDFQSVITQTPRPEGEAASELEFHMGKTSTVWRRGDPHPFAIDVNIIPAPPDRNPLVSKVWRNGDKRPLTLTGEDRGMSSDADSPLTPRPERLLPTPPFERFNEPGPSSPGMRRSKAHEDYGPAAVMMPCDILSAAKVNRGWSKQQLLPGVYSKGRA